MPPKKAVKKGVKASGGKSQPPPANRKVGPKPLSHQANELQGLDREGVRTVIRMRNHLAMVKRMEQLDIADNDAAFIINDENNGLDGSVVRVRDDARFLVKYSGCMQYQDMGTADTLGEGHRINWCIPYLNFDGSEEWPIVTPDKLLVDERGIFNVLKSARVKFENLHDYPLEVSMNVPMTEKTSKDLADPRSRSQATEFTLRPQSSHTVRLSYSPEVMGEYRFCEVSTIDGSKPRQYAGIADFLVKVPKYSDNGTILKPDAAMVAVSVSVDSYCTTLSDLGHVITPQGTKNIAKIDFRSRFVIQSITPSMVHMIVPKAAGNGTIQSPEVVLSKRSLGLAQRTDGTVKLWYDVKKEHRDAFDLDFDVPKGTFVQVPALSVSVLTNNGSGNEYEHVSICTYKQFDTNEWFLWDVEKDTKAKAYYTTLALNMFTAPARTVIFVVRPEHATAASALSGHYAVGLSLTDAIDGLTRVISILGHLSALISLF